MPAAMGISAPRRDRSHTARSYQSAVAFEKRTLTPRSDHHGTRKVVRVPQDVDGRHAGRQDWRTPLDRLRTRNHEPRPVDSDHHAPARAPRPADRLRAQPQRGSALEQVSTPTTTATVAMDALERSPWRKILAWLPRISRLVGLDRLLASQERVELLLVASSFLVGENPSLVPEDCFLIRQHTSVGHVTLHQCEPRTPPSHPDPGMGIVHSSPRATSGQALSRLLSARLPSGLLSSRVKTNGNKRATRMSQSQHE